MSTRLRFDPASPNMRLWLENEPTDTKATKGFNNGKFGGTATNGAYLRKRLTDNFGPVGYGWGYHTLNGPTGELHQGLLNEDGKPRNIVHVLAISLWYRHPESGEICTCPPVSGCTPFAFTTGKGTYSCDEDAFKKSETDALSRACMALGIAADIHLGLFDDSKYVTARKEAEVDNEVAIDAKQAALARAEAADRALALRNEMLAAMAPIVETLAEVQSKGDLDEAVAEARALFPRLKAGGFPGMIDELAQAVDKAKARILQPVTEPA